MGFRNPIKLAQLTAAIAPGQEVQVKNVPSTTLATQLPETLLATVPSAQTSVTVAIPAGCQALAIVGAGDGLAVQGTTTGFTYPFRQLLSPNAGAVMRSVVMVDSTVDPEVTISENQGDFYVVALFGPQAISAFLGAEEEVGSATPLTALLIGGTDGTWLRGISVDSSGRLILPPATSAASEAISLTSAPPVNASIGGSNLKLLRGATFAISASAVASIADFNVSDTLGGVLFDFRLSEPGDVALAIPLGPGGFQLQGELEVTQVNGSATGRASISAIW